MKLKTTAKCVQWHTHISQKTYTVTDKSETHDQRPILHGLPPFSVNIIWTKPHRTHTRTPTHTRKHCSYMMASSGLSYSLSTCHSAVFITHCFKALWLPVANGPYPLPYSKTGIFNAIFHSGGTFPLFNTHLTVWVVCRCSNISCPREKKKFQAFCETVFQKRL